MITLVSEEMIARLHPLGARLSHIGFRDGPNLVLDADPAHHPAWADCYGGVIVGPVANRVAQGRVEIDGTQHQMPQNEGDMCLHSGPNGVHAQAWTVIEQTPGHVSLGLVLEDGACGLPGRREIEARFRLAGTTLSLDLTASSDATTPLAFAHHPYWSLGGTQELQSDATHILPVDDRLIPTGDVAPVLGTPFDFSAPLPLPPHIDHNLCWDDARTQDQCMATLMGQNARLRIFSNQPGLQVYSGAHLPTLPGIAPFAGCALEPQNWPNAINTPHFPSPLVPARTSYHQHVRYAFDPAT